MKTGTTYLKETRKNPNQKGVDIYQKEFENR